MYNKTKRSGDKMPTLGENIKSARKKAGLTQKELAERINKGFSTVQKYEMDIIVPSIETFRRIAESLNTSIASLACDTNSKKAIVRAACAKLELEFAEDDREYITESIYRLNSEGVTEAANYIEYLLTKPNFVIAEQEKSDKDPDEK